MSREFDHDDDEQLAVWAFGRQGVVTDRELAEAALRELLRRGEAAAPDSAGKGSGAMTPDSSAAQGSAATAPAGVRDQGASLASSETPAEQGGLSAAAREHPDSPADDRHRRRMRRTGIAGIVAAALALVGGVAQLSYPSDDPLAVFTRPATAEDLAWADRLAQGFADDMTTGPRAIDLGGDLIAIVFRAAAVADGRSTEYDPYCMVISSGADEPDVGIINGGCTLPETFAAEGLIIPVGATVGGGGSDAVAWGPVGAPRLTTDLPLNDVGIATSAIGWMVYASFGPLDPDMLVGVDESDPLLLGPAPMPLVENAAFDLGIGATAYLVEGSSEASGPVLCAVATGPGTNETSSCAPLSTVRRSGLQFVVVADDREWVISIGADGPGRIDTLRAAD